MKKQIKLAAGALLATTMYAAAPVKAADWNGPQEPFEIYGNTYYVGTAGISAVLITSAAGHILIDGGTPQAPAMIAAHIRQLGFKVEDIKYILNSHEHFDHAGGIAELQKMSGAKVLSSPAAVKVLQSGQPDKGDPQFGDLDPSAPVANTGIIRDGDHVTLGPLSLTVHYTPGHTQGAVSWTWRSTEGGRTANMVYADSISARAAKGFRYSGNALYPNARADIERSIAVVDSLPCDVLISPHPEASNLWDRKAKQAQLGNAAFIDKNACHEYAAQARARLANLLADEARQGAPRAGR
jgi:metallo-beta-lactamase class B